MDDGVAQESERCGLVDVNVSALVPGEICFLIFIILFLDGAGRMGPLRRTRCRRTQRQ